MKKVIPIFAVILIAALVIGISLKKDALNADSLSDIAANTDRNNVTFNGEADNKEIDKVEEDPIGTGSEKEIDGTEVFVSEEKEDNTKQQKNSIIDLKFIVMPVEVLSPVVHDANWKLVDHKILLNVAGVEQILVSLYQKSEAEIKTILQDKHGFYDLGLSFEGEPERLTALAKDVNNDEALELVLIADKGTTYKEVKIYTYDGVNWKCMLTTENLLYEDLNNDGTEELITTSMGSLPGYIWIYRWVDQHFEKSDVVQDLGAVYAVLKYADGKTVIEAGKENDPGYYTYEDGRLLLVN